MTPSPLPSEIYYRIIGHIADRTDLCSLSLCCIAFRDEAQGKLFRHVSKLGFIEHGKFLDAIIASPKRLAPMVKYCRMTEGTRVKSEGVLMRDAASTALLLMCNLTTLRIRDEALSYIDISALLHCSFQLITCEFGCLGGWDDLDPLLFTFLRTQSSLRHLTIHGNLAESTHKELFRDDPEWCPNIQSLSAKGSVICMFLAPHRHIQCLDWHYFSDTFGSSPLSKVKYLAFPVYNTAPNLSFLPRMTSLVLLDVSFFSYLEISKTVRGVCRIMGTMTYQYWDTSSVFSKGHLNCNI